MASSSKIFNLLQEMGAVQAMTGSFNNHERLRTNLIKLNKRHKERMDGLGFLDAVSAAASICANFNSTTGVSSFVLQESSRTRTPLDFQIIEPGVLEDSPAVGGLKLVGGSKGG